MEHPTMKISGKIFDFKRRTFINGRLTVIDGVISSIEEVFDEQFEVFVIPGLIDSHVHIESSMLTPSRFSELVVPRGTVAVVSDPHEIANVMGVDGVDYMIDDSRRVPLKCFFGVPSCVPATSIEGSGAVMDASVVKELIGRDDLWFLSEMMNFPGVLGGDADVMGKIEAAQRVSKPVDGHAPGLVGESLLRYVGAGISTDHECFTLNEALAKIAAGMKIQIREGSAARNFEALYPLLTLHPDKVMLCTDDSHPDTIIAQGHMDRIVKMALAKGCSVFDVIQACSVNPVQHYGLPVGLLQVGDSADFIVIGSLAEFDVRETYIQGRLVAKDGNPLYKTQSPTSVNNFVCNPIRVSDIQVGFKVPSSMKVLTVEDGELVTGKSDFLVTEGFRESDLLEHDLLKLVVVDRYNGGVAPSVAYVQGFGLKRGALAGSVSHDNHNIIAVGVSDAEIAEAVNLVVRYKGGIAVVDGEETYLLPLPIAGIISDKTGNEVAALYESLNRRAKEMGTLLSSPFMTLSFMSLIVIPELKLGAKGLFDVNKFSYVPLFE